MTDIPLILVLSLHLLCVNVAAAGPLICVWLDLKEGRGDKLAGTAGRQLAWQSWTLFLVGMVLGCVVGALKWSEQYAESLMYLGASLWFAISELGFSLVLMVLHWWWWKKRPECSKRQRIGRSVLPVLAATNLLYHFPFLFGAISKMSAWDSIPEGVLSRKELLQLMMTPDIFSLTVHFWLASFAVSGLVLVWQATRNSRANELSPEDSRLASWGGRIALVTTLLQIPVGIWVVLKMPQESRQLLMGGDLLATIAFGFALLVAFGLMHQLAQISFSNCGRRTMGLSMATMVVIVVLMTAVLQLSKTARISEATNAMATSPTPLLCQMDDVK